MRTTCVDKPSGMQDYAKNGSLMQCSLLTSTSNSFNWEQLAGSLQVGFCRNMVKARRQCSLLV
jgi:hypothetical protein